MAVKIGITCNMVDRENRLSLAYVRAVAAAGAVPLLFPVGTSLRLQAAMLKTVDGLLLSGGGDPDASWYGEEALPVQGEVIPQRDKMELHLARLALKKNIPVLGICRGAQILCIAAGGTLYQDIGDRAGVQHCQKAPRNYPIHRVRLVEESLLGRITGEKEIRVNSFHHQAVKTVKGGMVISAYAADGIPEAVELPGHPFAVGVQWHPEWLVNRFPHARRLFAAFIHAAGAKKPGRE